MKELKKSTRREPVSRKKNTAEKKEQTAKKSTKKNTGKEIKKENKKDTEKGTWKSVTKERVYDPNGKVLMLRITGLKTVFICRLSLRGMVLLYKKAIKFISVFYGKI